MSLREFVFGRALRTEEEGQEKIGPLAAIPVLGFDALASAAYGPEAALTLLIPLGHYAPEYVVPITCAIVAVLFAVYFSYRQTIAAYPGGGGSFTVARENLGPLPGLLAACSLMLDYVLNVAVAISAGVGAVASVAPPLLPHTLPLCLLLLGLLALANLRGVRSVGVLFMLPMYAFVLCVGLALSIGIGKTLLAGGNPLPVVTPRPAAVAAATAATPWLLLRAFASGCTALTGVEAVSNAVPIFRRPTIKLARRTLTIIVCILAFFLGGIAFLSRSYGIVATTPGEPGFESQLSQLVSAVAGRGLFYYLTMSTVFAVLVLSANTSFADFPRVCRTLALAGYLPATFAHRGRRLVYSSGIVLLAMVSGGLLIIFGGITDRLIPLFAIGAFGAFTLSQMGMVQHWRRAGGRGSRHFMVINGIGALATLITLGVIAVSKFSEGAWMTLLVIPALLFMFVRMRRHARAVAAQTSASGPLDLRGVEPPIVVIPIRRLDRGARIALRLGVSISPEVYAVQVQADEIDAEDLTKSWQECVIKPARAARRAAPQLVLLPSAYRELVTPLLRYVRELAARHPGRRIGVIVPELLRLRWYNGLLRPRAALLEAWLLLRGGPQIAVIHTPWYQRE
jgi:hypothetical protein